MDQSPQPGSSGDERNSGSTRAVRDVPVWLIFIVVVAISLALIYFVGQLAPTA
jgi:hypothetical protein